EQSGSTGECQQRHNRWVSPGLTWRTSGRREPCSDMADAPTPGRRGAAPSVHPDAGVAEHAQPAGIFLPRVRTPGVLHRAEYPLLVRLHYGHPTVATGKAADAARRAVLVGRVVFGDLAVVVDKAQIDGAGQVGLHQCL